MTPALATLLLMSLWASPGPPATPDVPGARPKPIPLPCHRPLELGDFNRYDIVANQQLHRSELTRRQFACLVNQLIRTRDRRVRAHFIGRLQNDLWEAVRRELLRLRRSPDLAPELRARIDYLLTYDLSNRVVRVGTNIRYLFLWDQVIDRNAGLRTLYRYSLHQTRGSGVLSINLPFAGWRFKSNATLAASYFWGATDERQSGAPASEAAVQRQSYPALEGTSGLSLTERRARFRLVFSSQVLRYWEPLADRLASRALVSGTLEVRKPWGSGFGARVVGSWRADRYAPPLADDYNRQQLDQARVTSELSYQFGRVGVVGTHAYADTESTTAFNVTVTRRNTPSLLGHLRFKGGYFRFGGGGGVWRESFKQLDDPEPSITKGASGHGRLEVQWQPLKWLSGNAVATVAANRSEGDFNGWYPSWSSSMKLMVSTRSVSAQAYAGAAGHHRDLDHRQDKLVGWASGEAMVHTSDRWNLRTVVWGGRARQTRYQQYDESWWGGSFSVGVRLLARPDLWLETGGSCSGYRYVEDTLTRDQVKVTGSVYASGRF